MPRFQLGIGAKFPREAGGGAIRESFAVAEWVARCFGVTAQTPPWSAWHPDRYCRGASSLPGFPAMHRGAP